MPYSVKKRNCKDSKGKKGKYIVTKKGKNKQLSCHTSKSKAKASTRARYANELHNIVFKNVLFRLLLESKKQTARGSHPEETYKYGWPEYDEKWFDKKGITTWDEDREWTKQYFKNIGLL
tara:strand:- start:412 stop:771 length:360 start_codon:yes stop_codon:yes gene_type:complete